MSQPFPKPEQAHAAPAVKAPRDLGQRLSANLERSAQILEALLELKQSLQRQSHPEMSLAQARLQVAWETVARKEKQWKRTPVSPTD